MHGLAYVNSQLDTIAAQDNWSRHGELMANLDAELAEFNQKVRNVLSLHELVTELDSICFRAIESGKMSLGPQPFDLFREALGRFRAAGTALLNTAREFTNKGIPVTGLARLRQITENPGAGLSIAPLAVAVSCLGGSTDGLPPEMPFDDRVLNAIAEAGKAYRRIGND